MTALTYPDVAAALYDALRDDPFYAGLAARVAGDGRAALLQYFDISCRMAADHGVLTAWSGPIVGAALWAKPGVPADAVAAVSARLHQAIGADSYALYRAVAAGMGKLSAPHVEETDWYLSILGLDPAHRGKGLGAGLVRPVLEQADAAGVASYLETFTPGNIKFYEGLGYRTVARIEEPVLGAAYHVLRRAPL